MCYLPKATFYCYFGFFFLGYLWVFGILFYNTWESGQRMSQMVAKSRAWTSWAELPLFRADGGTSNGGPCFKLRTEPGIRLCIHDPLRDKFFSAHINAQRHWEKELTLQFQVVLSRFPDSVFVDVGANLGFFTILAAKLGHMVISVEPFLHNLVLMHESAVLNAVSEKIIFVRAVVSEVSGNVTILRRASDLFHFDLGREEAAGQGELVPTVALDDILALPVLQTAQRSLSAVVLRFADGHCRGTSGAARFFSQLSVPVIIFEMSGNQSRSTECMSQLAGKLTSLHYKPFDVSGQLLDLFIHLARTPRIVLWKK